MKTKRDKNIIFWIISIILIFLSLFNLTTFQGVISLICGLLIFPPIINLFKSKLNFEIKLWLKNILIIIGIIFLILAFGSSSKPSTGQGIIPSTYSACDFLPDKSIIPTEFVITEAKTENNSCSQMYRQSTAFGSSFNLKLYLFDSVEEADNFYTNLTEKEKSERGYTELSTMQNCYSVQRETLLASFVYLYCKMNNLVYKEEIVESGWYDTNTMINLIHSNVASKIKEAINI